MTRLYRMPAPFERYNPQDEAQFRLYLERELGKAGLRLRTPAAPQGYSVADERSFRRQVELALQGRTVGRRFIAPRPGLYYNRLNEAQFRRQLEGLVLGGNLHQEVWAWWRARSNTYTDTTAVTATSPTGPSATNPVRAWVDTIGSYKLFLEFNPTTGEPRHHTPTDGTGINGLDSIEYFDGGNKHACTSGDLLTLAAGVRKELVFMTVVDMNAGGAATQTIAGFRDTEAASADESVLLWRRTAGAYATARRFENGAVQTVSAGTVDNEPHVRTHILYRDSGGLLRCTTRVDGVELGDSAIETAGAGDFVWTRFLAGNGDYRAAATGTLHGFVAELLVAPYDDGTGAIFDWASFEADFLTEYGL